MLNLHNHSTFSDGDFKVDELIRAAIKSELKFIAITDHYLTSKLPLNSVTPDQIDIYIENIDNIAKSFKKKIKVLKGLEIDFCILRTNFTTLPYEHLKRLDFILLEYVNEKEALGLGLEELIKIREYFPNNLGLAHNDLEKNFGSENFDALIDRLEEFNIFVELCPSLRYGRGITPYYYFAEEFFVKIKGRKVKISIGTDTHNDLQEVGKITNAWEFVRFLKLEKNLLIHHL